MSYEKEQSRLLQLMDETGPYITEYDDDFEDDDEIDNLEMFDEDTASEQDVSDGEEHPVASSVPYFLGRDGTTKWNKHCPTRNVRTRSENIITHLPGVKGEAKKVKTPIDIWQCFINDHIFNIIVENTNKFIASGFVGVAVFVRRQKGESSKCIRSVEKKWNSNRTIPSNHVITKI